MASVIDSFSEAISEDKFLLKVCIYAIPVYFCAKFFLKGSMSLFTFYGSLTAILLFGLITAGINSVRTNKKEVLTLNPLRLLDCIIRSLFVLVPQGLLFGFIGYLIISFVKIPVEIPHFQLIFEIIVWALLGSIVFTAYLSFAKYLNIAQGFRYGTIIESCMDVFVNLLFYIPQALIANVILVGPVAYLFTFFNVPLTEWGFVAYCSIIFVLNVSMFANYFAQSAFEHIRGTNAEYKDNSQIDLVKDVHENDEVR